MTGSWLAYALLVGVLLAGTARCLSEACRLAARPTRWVWIAALGLTVVLVTLAPYRMAPPAVTLTRTLALPSSSLRSAGEWVPAEPSSPSWMERVRTIGPAVATPMQAAIATAGTQIPQDLMHHFTTLWLSLSALLLCLCVATYVRFHRLRYGWPLTDLDGVRVRVAPEGGPAVVGWSRPEIIVPYWLFRHAPEQRRLVLAHEREHVNARDPLLIAVGCVVAVLLPWHPAVWWMFARLRLAVELDCDTRVLRQGIAPRQYGALLIDLAGRCPGMPMGAPALADKSSHLRHRILAMRTPRLSFARTRGAALGILAAVVLIAACVLKIPNVVAQGQQAAPEVAATPAQPAPALSPLESMVATAPRQDSRITNRIARRFKWAAAPARPALADSAAMVEFSPVVLRTSPALVLADSQAVQVQSSFKFVVSETATPDTAISNKIAADFATGESHVDTTTDVVLRNVGSPAPDQLQIRLGGATDFTAAGHYRAQIQLPVIPSGLKTSLTMAVEDSSNAFITFPADSNEQKNP